MDGSIGVSMKNKRLVFKTLGCAHLLLMKAVINTKVEGWGRTGKGLGRSTCVDRRQLPLLREYPQENYS